MSTMAHAEAQAADRLELAALNKPAQAAEYLTVSIPTLARWRMEGRGPKFVRMGSSVRYTREALEEFVRESIASAG